ncbi:MAG TPA: glycosyltransferase family 4 protein [Ktedonobacteraceae bacterium]|nr:glycosyltransferase family 4 protein [Ktedonobacteraceae bacterium]
MCDYDSEMYVEDVEGILSVRILFVTPYVPSRIRVRPFNLIKSLSAVHDISLVALFVDDYELAMVKDIEEYCVSVDLVPLPRWQAYTNCLRALPTLMPLRVAYYRSPAFVQRIKEVIEKQKIVVVHGELIKVVPALKAVLAEQKIPILYDSVDCISWFLQQEIETTPNILKKAFVYSELQKMRRYEGTKLHDFDQLIITSAADRKRLGRLTGQPQNIQVVSNCVDTDYFKPEQDFREVDSLVYCAKLDYFPNAQAILHFCEHTLPLVWKRHPHVRLSIVGSNPPQSVRALAVDTRITVTGYVPDIRPYLGTATVALAPLLVAAGTQFKILEALAMGTPMVTTPRCSLALGTQHGVHLLVAEEPQEYADAIVKLLDNPQLAERLGAAGRWFVLENYSWSNAADTLNRLYDTTLARPGQRDLATSLAMH